MHRFWRDQCNTYPVNESLECSAGLQIGDLISEQKKLAKRQVQKIRNLAPLCPAGVQLRDLIRAEETRQETGATVLKSGTNSQARISMILWMRFLQVESLTAAIAEALPQSAPRASTSGTFQPPKWNQRPTTTKV